MARNNFNPIVPGGFDDGFGLGNTAPLASAVGRTAGRSSLARFSPWAIGGSLALGATNSILDATTGASLFGGIGNVIHGRSWGESEAEYNARIAREKLQSSWQNARTAAQQTKDQTNALLQTSQGQSLSSISQDAGDMGKSDYESIRNNMQQMGASYINNAVLSVQKDAYVKQQQLTETQRKYGITGAVANAQQQEFDMQTTQMLADTQNKAAMQWFQTYGVSMAAADQQKDIQTYGLTQKISQEIMNNPGADIDGMISNFQAIYGNDYADWDKLKGMSGMTQDQARIANDLLNQQNPIVSGVGVQNLLQLGSAFGSVQGQRQVQSAAPEDKGFLQSIMPAALGAGIGYFMPGYQGENKLLKTLIGNTSRSGRTAMTGGILGAGIGALL